MSSESEATTAQAHNGLDPANAHLRTKMRQAAAEKGLLSDAVDHEWNRERFIVGYGPEEHICIYTYLRHLQLRHLLDMDDCDRWHEPQELTENYSPIAFIGPTGLDNRFLVLNAAGRIDLVGLAKAAVPWHIITDRLVFQERIQRVMMSAERATGAQSGVVYVLDAAGLHVAPAQFTLVTVSYRILLMLVYMNYPEWIHKFFIINCPTIMRAIWAALSPFVPTSTKQKICMFTHQKEWLPALLEHVRADRLPEHWGGALKPDAPCQPPFCNSVCVPEGLVPERLYWSASDASPARAQLAAVDVPAAQYAVLSYVVTQPATAILINKACDREHTWSVWFDPLPAQLQTVDLDNLLADLEPSTSANWLPDIIYPGFAATDDCRIKANGEGVYHFKVGNRGSWFRSLRVHYRVRFELENGEIVAPQPINNPSYAKKMYSYLETHIPSRELW